MRRKATSRPIVASRERILNAAIDVGVDVAYVHRCFGSKERLFAEALEASAHVAEHLAGPPEALADSLAAYIFSARARRGRALDIFIRSVSSPEAAPVLRQFILDHVASPLSEKIDRPNATRIALIIALLTGVAIFRNVLRIGPMLETKGGELEELIANAIQGIIDGAERAATSGELEQAG